MSSPLEQRLQALVDEARQSGAAPDFVRRLRNAADELEAGAASAPATPPPSDVDRFALVGTSAPMRAMFDLIDRLAPTDVPVLVRGETGTGKEGVCRRLHQLGPRRSKPFVAIDCGAIPATLIESELFGHVRGAFTGADRDRPGHIVVADGGTLVLDEVGELPLALQPKLLRVLQEGELRPVGGNAVRKVDVRIIAATNRDLARSCKEGRFRQDLYFRLAVVEIVVPPLRDRLDDLPLLVEHLVARIAAESGGALPKVEPSALARLARHSWPGNVRELENALRRCLALGLDPIDEAALAGALGA